MGRETDGYVSGLTLQQTDSSTSTPVYYVNVRAINSAGAVSSHLTSSGIKVVQEDEAGEHCLVNIPCEHSLVNIP